MDNKENFNKEIKSVIDTRTRTTFIFCLDCFERHFGDLWGEFKDDDQPLTDSEQKYYDLYMKARGEILDMGNYQRRLANKEIGNIIGQ